ncbi:MAG: glycyl-radical enzyme activating protein [Bacilli bacterium]|jgi:pyruvate formate lyase activating enzyme
MYGKYVSIKYYEIHDGDGVRTTLFLKGCPLHCAWCHNPECISFQNQIGFFQDNCKNCGLCSLVCPSQAHYMENGVHKFERSKCNSCGKCAEVCTYRALAFYGKDASVDEIVDLITKDQPFHRALGGGVTISGGEPLAQKDFTLAIARKLKEKNINVAIDTTLYAPKETIIEVAEYIDTFLVDAKAASTQTHKKLTDVDNDIIYQNMALLNQLGKPMEIRVPFLPTYNADEMEDIAKKIVGFHNITAVKVLPYHYYAKDKYRALGWPYPSQEIKIPTNEEISKARDIFTRYGFKVIKE